MFGYKDEIESKTLDNFERNTKIYNTWFKDTRSEIIKLERKRKYNEHTRSIFKTYLTSNNDEFKDTLNTDKSYRRKDSNQ